MSLNDVKTIPELIRDLEREDDGAETTTSKYVQICMREDIDKTDAYINSKHISGDTDYMGREKPFFNIVMAARNVWYRATDIDRKDIKVRATKSTSVIPAFLATLKLQEWMKKVDFGQFLNDWGLSLATHGSSVTKFIEKDSKLSAQVIDWNNLLCDPIDFENNIKVEKLFLTPAQVRKRKGWDKEMVKQLLDSLTVRETMDGQQKDSKADYIEIYELHGELPLSLITDDDKDDETYVQQMHVVSLNETKEMDSKGSEADSYTLYRGKETKDPYMITHLIEKEGQTYSGGAVKNLFEAQWMTNHSAKQIKDQLDLASKIIFQTSDGSFVDKNVLTNIENGDILKHAKDQPLTMLNNKPDISAMQAFKADWQNIAGQINGINEAMVQAPKSGTAWRQTEAVLQEAHSLFELMTENKGLAIIQMLRVHVLPYFKKTLNNSEEISMILEDHQIKEIDRMYVPSEVTRMMNNKKKKTILSGEVFDLFEEEGMAAASEEEVKANITGSQRFIKPSQIDSKTWKEVFKDIEWELDIDVTGEMKDVQSAMATLTTVLQTVAGNPQAMQDPTFKLLLGKILMNAGGLSPLELSEAQQQQPEQLPMEQLVPQPA
uniref:Portal protein n=1 Tax=uncultured marine virus TaxID=186617 RepID=A0A0F7L673_9VIRU|nr:hypothetical protein [uncultured marine virus]